MINGWLVAWWVSTFIITPCPLKDPDIARKYFMQTHISCPASHGTFTQVATPHWQVFQDSATANAFYHEISFYFCGRYEKNEQYDCIQRAEWGWGQNSDTDINRRPSIIIDSWEDSGE